MHKDERTDYFSGCILDLCGKTSDDVAQSTRRQLLRGRNVIGADHVNKKGVGVIIQRHK